MVHTTVINTLPAPTHWEVLLAGATMDFLVMVQTHVQVSKSVPFLMTLTFGLDWHLDINECEHNNGGCEGECHNTVGSYYCSCDPSQVLDDNQRNCSGKCKLLGCYLYVKEKI